MRVVDEYLAVRVIAGDWPDELPDDDDIALPASRHWRLLQRVHAPSGGQLTALLAQLSTDERDALRHPHPEVLHILDPRPLLDEAAAINARFSSGGLLTAETLAAGLAHGHELWFGPGRNVGRRLREIASDLSITVRVLD
jgi:hypothetical protein